EVIIPTIPKYANPYKLTPGVSQRLRTPKALYEPWCPSRLLLKKRNVRARMQFLLDVLETEKEVEFQKQRNYPDFKVGDVLDVTMVAAENERKTYVHRGLCIQKRDRGYGSSFKLYCVFSDSGGFIQHLPLCMPDILDIKIVGQVDYKDEEDLKELVESESRECKFLDKVL
uniref:bL19m n=1 Tax=Polytomella magna TaxID=353565 RepID=UPI002240E3DE|nr:Chain An, bL19m [Polytomella magna]8APN_An Chain An, bL19m [Polytomella magna]8APO_An Chain An, bL19m [Polytomella magna]